MQYHHGDFEFYDSLGVTVGFSVGNEVELELDGSLFPDTEEAESQCSFLHAGRQYAVVILSAKQQYSIVACCTSG